MIQVAVAVVLWLTAVISRIPRKEHVVRKENSGVDLSVHPGAMQYL